MAVANIPLDKAYLTAIWLETLFYGINMFLFFSYLFIARYKRKVATNPFILFTAITMFLFSTIHCSLGFSRLIEGFIYLRDQPGGPGAYFSNVSVPLNVTKVTIHTINSILGDSIVVWRCYHVWGRDWKICVLPVLLIIASAVCGFGQGVIFAQAREIHSAFGVELEHWNGSVFILSLCTNVLVTTLIAARIWFISRQINSVLSTSFKYRRVLALVVESGSIYSSALVIEITLYFLNSNGFYIIYDPIAQLTGIVPTMIIIMTTLGMTSSDLDSKEEMSNSHGMVISAPRFAARPTTTTFTTSTDNQGLQAGLYPEFEIEKADKITTSEST
ncbi:hypothetical protein C8J56DRAFT_927929 [Mycena floridula]|nr:hypothetical protein C8J56DRAFT_927929 [Mycena floridula]